MVESGRVSGKGRIRSSTQKLLVLVARNGIITVITEKWQNPGEYQEKVEAVPVPKNCPYE